MKSMRIASFVIVFACLAVAAGCGDSESPTAPTSSPAVDRVSPLRAPSLAPVLHDAAGVPGGGGGGIDHLAPGGDGFNAYDFFASYDDGMLSLALVEDEMRSMREASKPHRMRRVTVGHCPVEPHHALQSCGRALWTGRVRLAGRVELDPIALPACEGWVVVHADELFDDVRDGWRNAPCPAAGGGEVGSDGSGDGWPDYPEPEKPEPPAPAVTNGPPVITDPGAMTFSHGSTITSFPVTVTDPDGDTVTVTVEGLPDGLTWSGGMVSGTVSSSAAVRDYRVTIAANDGVNDPVTVEFTITVIPTWILLADSLTAARNLGNTGAGPDSGTWPLRWARWYYATADPTWTIVQFYSEGSWAHGGTGLTGCRVDSDGGREWNAYLTVGGGVSTVDAELLSGDTSDTAIRRQDANGNDISRVPTG